MRGLTIPVLCAALFAPALCLAESTADTTADTTTPAKPRKANTEIDGFRALSGKETLLKDLDVTIDGFARARYLWFGVDNSEGRGQFDWSDYRISATLGIGFNPHLTLYAGFDAYDNFIAGSNGPTSNLLSQTTTNTRKLPPHLYGGTANGDDFVLKTLYLDLWSEYGTFQVGRLPLDWGLGLLLNSGEKPDADFTLNGDRFFYRSPVFDLEAGYLELPLTFAVGYTHLSEGRVNDLDDDGREFLLQVAIDNEWNYQGLMYRYRHFRNNGAPLATGEVRFDNGALHTIDWAFRTQLGPLKAEGEVAYTAGTLDVSSATTALSEVNMFAWNVAARLSYSPKRFGLGGEFGYSSGGDDNALRISQVGGVNERGSLVGTSYNSFPMNPNYHVDLILFRELLASVTAATASPFDDTWGSVSNATYYKVFTSYECSANITTKLNVLYARLNDTSIYETFGPVLRSDVLGWEINAQVWYQRKFFAGNRNLGTAKLGLLGGVAAPGEFFKDLDVFNGRVTSEERNAGVDSFTDDMMWTVQTHLIWKF